MKNIGNKAKNLLWLKENNIPVANFVIIKPENVIVGVGYNGLPRGLKNEEFPWDREGEFLNIKYTYVCHAEENAIFNSNNTTKDCKIYCTLFPCNECAKSIIQNGIKEVIFESDKYHNEPAFIASRKMLDAAGVKQRQYFSDWSK